MLKPLKSIWEKIAGHQSPTPARRDSDGSQWCLVGNIIEEREFGEGGKETRRGTKHFSPGTKVYCLPAQWGDGYDQIVVIGRHRGSKKFARMIISCSWVTNWRAKVVYEPQVLRLFETGGGKRGQALWYTKEEVEQYVDDLRKIEKEQRAT